MQVRLDGTVITRIVIVFSLEATDHLGKNTITSLEVARDYCNHNDVDVVVLTGGLFNSKKGQIVPAATMMSWWWREQYQRKSGLILETDSLTTRQNITNSVQRLSQHGYKLAESYQVVVVSERYHLMGISLLFWLLHHRRVITIPSDFRISFREKVQRLLRLPMYLWDPRGVGWLSRRKLRARTG